MKKNKASFLIVCLLTLLSKVSLLAQSDSITVATYYPAPFASYQELRTDSLGIGASWVGFNPPEALPNITGVPVINFRGMNNNPANFAAANMMDGSIYYNSTNDTFWRYKNYPTDPPRSGWYSMEEACYIKYSGNCQPPFTRLGNNGQQIARYSTCRQTTSSLIVGIYIRQGGTCAAPGGVSWTLRGNITRSFVPPSTGTAGANSNCFGRFILPTSIASATNSGMARICCK